MIGEEQPGAPKTEEERRFAFLEDKNMRRGAKWGLLIGFAIAMYQIQVGSQAVGFYTGNVAMVFIGWIGGGLLLGLIAGWLASYLPPAASNNP